MGGMYKIFVKLFCVRLFPAQIKLYCLSEGRIADLKIGSFFRCFCTKKLDSYMHSGCLDSWDQISAQFFRSTGPTYNCQIEITFHTPKDIVTFGEDRQIFFR